MSLSWKTLIDVSGLPRTQTLFSLSSSGVYSWNKNTTSLAFLRAQNHLGQIKLASHSHQRKRPTIKLIVCSLNRISAVCPHQSRIKHSNQSGLIVEICGWELAIQYSTVSISEKVQREPLAENRTGVSKPQNSVLKSKSNSNEVDRMKIDSLTFLLFSNQLHLHHTAFNFITIHSRF